MIITVELPQPDNRGDFNGGDDFHVWTDSLDGVCIRTKHRLDKNTAIALAGAILAAAQRC